ncbi:C45 family peptidase [Aquabacter sp. CN5-332]|uniref:C45 family peptidase n=1 Tax=Aquabacter sp. CN5-332 TaxID=3156608 RepID=UPI0032B5A350
MQAVPSLTVGDDPRERGRLHGARFADDIASNLETYLRRFEASGLDRDTAFLEGNRWFASIRRQNEEYAEEMRGIAEGSRHGDPAIAVLNARYELAFTLFGQDAARNEALRKELLTVGPDGCTTFGLLPETTADGHTWLGQNWDWLEGVHNRNLVLRVRRKDRPSFVCLTEAGIVGGKMGVNEEGIGLVENGLASSNDGVNPYEKPFHMRCREVLDAGRYDNALRPIVDTRRTCSANFMIGHADGEIIDIETSPNHLTYLHPEGGVLTHSNHFVGTGHGESQMEKIAPNTLYRSSRIRRLLTRTAGAISLDDMKAAAQDHFGFPNAICRHPDETQPPAKRTMTTGAVLIDLNTRTMHVANGPPCTYPYVPFTIDGEE